MSDTDCINRSTKVTAKRAKELFEDSEDEYFESLNEGSKRALALSQPPKPTPPPPSKQSAKTASTLKATSAKPPPPKRRRDSDDESVPRRKAAKRKQTKKEDWKTFDSESEGEVTKLPQQLYSSYSKRVADGVVRRSAILEGGLYLDLKLYQVDDIKNVNFKKRYEKAVLALRLQADHDSPELSALRQLLRRSKVKFPEEAYFYADRVQ